jgi:hypothetical protein
MLDEKRTGSFALQAVTRFEIAIHQRHLDATSLSVSREHLSRISRGTRGGDCR